MVKRESFAKLVADIPTLRGLVETAMPDYLLPDARWRAGLRSLVRARRGGVSPSGRRSRDTSLPSEAPGALSVLQRRNEPIYELLDIERFAEWETGR